MHFGATFKLLTRPYARATSDGGTTVMITSQEPARLRRAGSQLTRDLPSPSSGDSGLKPLRTESCRLPSFLAVGPPRTGTTWLHKALEKHANLPRHNKETRFFDTYYSKGLRWYCAHFDRSAFSLPLGEVCPTYFYSEQARTRIAELVPDMRIICTLRDPVERIFSLYRIKRAYGAPLRSLDEALLCDPELMESSRYVFHLSRWQALFGDKNVLITIYDDLVWDPQAYIDRIVDFIGIPRFQLKGRLTLRINSSENAVNPVSFRWTRFSSIAADWLKEHRLGALVTAVKKTVLLRLFVGAGPEIPSLDPATAGRLREMFRPEVERLEELLERDLSDWKSPQGVVPRDTHARFGTPDRRADT